jgi:hypothetical protein
MQYKTITLSLIEQRPQWHQQLQQSGTMQATLDHYANLLSQSHEQWKAELMGQRGESDSILLASEALELAMQDFQDNHLPAAANLSNETFNLDAAMAFVKRHTPQT